MSQTTCCFCFGLREGVITLLLISLVGTLNNFFTYRNSKDYSDSVKYAYTLQCMVELPFIILGLVGVFRRKAILVSTYAYYQIIRLLFGMGLSVVVLLSSLPFSDDEIVFIFIAIVFAVAGYALTAYFIYVFLAYSRQLREEEEERKEFCQLREQEEQMKKEASPLLAQYDYGSTSN